MTDIDDLGKRLVKESQDRRDQIRRRQERYEKKAAIASLIVPVGAKIIEDGLIRKSQDFFNQENVLNLTREYNKAATNAAGVISTEQKIQASGVDTQTYFADLNFEAAKTQITDLLTEEQKGGREMLNAAQINMRARTIANDQGALQSKEHNEALAIAVNLGTREDFHAERDRVLKPTTPTTLTGWVGRGITTALGGDSTQERQATAIADFKRGGQFETLDHLNTAVDEFKDTNSWRSAFSKAAEDSTQPEVTQYWRDKVDSITGMEDYASAEWKYHLTSSTDARGNQIAGGFRYKLDSYGEIDPDTREKIEPLELSTDPEMAARFQMQYTNGLRASFDPNTDTKPYLTKLGFEKWQAKIRENKREGEGEDGSSISLQDWSGQNEWDIVVDSWQNFMDENKNDASIFKEDSLTQAQAIVLEVRLKSTYMGDLEEQLLIDKVMFLKTNNAEEYAEAKNYYMALEIDPDQTKIEQPTNYGKYELAILAERNHEDAVNVILNGVRNEGIVLPDDYDAEAAEDAKAAEDAEAAEAAESDGDVVVSREREERVDLDPNDFPEEPASLVALKEELETAPETGRRQMGREMGRTQTNVQRDINNWEEKTKNKISRLESAINSHERGDYHLLERVIPELVPRKGVPITATRKALADLEAELEQYSIYNQFEEDLVAGRFSLNTTPNSLLADTDPK